MTEVRKASKTLEPAVSLVTYDHATGRIHQVHHFAAMSGADLPAGDKLHQLALEHAAGVHKREPASIRVLAVEAHHMKPGTRYRVQDGKLVSA